MPTMYEQGHLLLNTAEEEFVCHCTHDWVTQLDPLQDSFKELRDNPNPIRISQLTVKGLERGSVKKSNAADELKCPYSKSLATSTLTTPCTFPDYIFH